MKQRTLILIKPDAMELNLADEIVSRYKQRGLRVVAISQPFMADEQTAKKHYKLDDYNYVLTLGHEDMSGKTEEEKDQAYKRKYKIVEDLQKFLSSGPIIKIILEREKAVEVAREVTGKTDPAKSPKGSIRGDLSDDSFEKSDKEGRCVHNLVHASGTPQEAEEEIKLWFGEK